MLILVAWPLGPKHWLPFLTPSRVTPVPYALTYLAKGPPTLSIAPDMDELILEQRYFMRTVDLIVVLQQRDDASVISLFSGR